MVCSTTSLRTSAVGRPDLAIDGEIENALAGVALFALVEGDAGAFQEPVQRLFRRADTRTAAFLGNIRRGGGQVFDDQRQAARGDIA